MKHAEPALRLARSKRDLLNSFAGNIGIANGVVLSGSAAGLVLGASLLNTCIGAALSIDKTHYHDVGAVMKTTLNVMFFFIMAASSSLFSIWFRHSRNRQSAAYLGRIIFEVERGGQIDLSDGDVNHDKGGNWAEWLLLGLSAISLAAGLILALYAYSLLMNGLLS